jgi:hypothetical protein
LLKLYSMRREPVNTGFGTIRGRDNAPDPGFKALHLRCLLLVRLFQQTTSGSVERCRGRPSRTYHGVSRDQLQVSLDEFRLSSQPKEAAHGRLPDPCWDSEPGGKPTAYNEIRGAADLLRSKPQVIGAS